MLSRMSSLSGRMNIAQVNIGFFTGFKKIKQRHISFVLGYLCMILWKISTAISIKHRILETFNIKNKFNSDSLYAFKQWLIMLPWFLFSFTMHFILIKPVLSDHLPYLTIFHCSLGRSHKAGLLRQTDSVSIQKQNITNLWDYSTKPSNYDLWLQDQNPIF
jgi:hypothetical protein